MAGHYSFKYVWVIIEIIIIQLGLTFDRLFFTVPAEPRQDELQHSQKHSGPPRTTKTANGVQGSQTGMD